jgi:hypothetical protein
MRKVLRASVLILALGCPTFAGDMGCPTIVSPPTSSAQEQSASGEMQFPLIRSALRLFGTVLVLF